MVPGTYLVHWASTWYQVQYQVMEYWYIVFHTMSNELVTASAGNQ